MMYLTSVYMQANPDIQVYFATSSPLVAGKFIKRGLKMLEQGLDEQVNRVRYREHTDVELSPTAFQSQVGGWFQQHHKLSKGVQHGICVISMSI